MRSKYKQIRDSLRYMAQ